MTKDDLQSIRNMLLKVARLAKEGTTEGERQAAANRLKRLMEKYNLTEADLVEKQPRRQRLFEYEHAWERRLLGQIIGYVQGKEHDGTYYYHRRNNNLKTKRVWFETTDAEEKQIRVLYAHYRDAFEVELRRFMSAFIQKNNLGVGQGKSLDEFTQEELEELQRMMNLMNGITPTPRIDPSRMLEAKE